MAKVITITLGPILLLLRKYHEFDNASKLTYDSSFPSLLVRPLEADDPDTGFYFDNIFGVFTDIEEALD